MVSISLLDIAPGCTSQLVASEIHASIRLSLMIWHAGHPQYQYNEYFQKIIKSSQKLGEISLFIDDSPNLSIASLRTRARRLKRKHNLNTN